MSDSNTPAPVEPGAPQPAATPASTPVETTPQSATPAPATETPAFVPHTETPSLLETIKAPGATVEAPKTAEPPASASDPAKPDEPAPVETKPAEPAPAVAEPISYPEWKLPDGVQPDREALSKYTELLGEHRIAPEVGQALLDRHTAAMQQYAEHLSREQHRVFGETRAQWNKEIMADPELGGAGHQTAMGAIARMRDRFISSAKPGTEQYRSDESAFNQFLAITGAGDHPQFHKMLHRIAAVLDEPKLPPANAGPVPNGGMPKKTGMASIYKPSSDARGGPVASRSM
jgi:hypothetical protein